MGFEERVHEMDQEHRELRRNLNEARDSENDAIRKARNAEDDLRRMKKRLEETEDELNEKLRKKEQRYDQVQEENSELIGHHNKSQMTLMALRNELEGAAERERDWRQKCRSLQEDLNRTKFALSSNMPSRRKHPGVVSWRQGAHAPVARLGIVRYYLLFIIIILLRFIYYLYILYYYYYILFVIV